MGTQGTDALVAEAHAAAAAAAAASGVRIGDVHSHAHITAVSRLFDDVWGRDPDAGGIMAPELLHAMEHAGCQVTGAFDGDTLVGATAAILGMDEEQGLFLHSHITGIVAGSQLRGVGWALKQYQRAWCLARGIGTVRWTFDPLVRRNAVFNLVKLGARPIAWLDDAYGPMRDRRNAGLPTDRFLVRWDLAEARVARAAAGTFAEPRLEGLRRAGAVEVLRDEGGEPVRVEADAPRLLAQVPADIEALRAEAPERARRWADAVRDTVGAAMRGEHRLIGVTRDGWYVLTRDDEVEELR
ncbi:MAG: GNAT family N-acetyltransferase [Actinobacteria bacterium]|nr:GNAT family N-acetyltransferase [Actinomycetota bacterium]